MVSDGGFSDVLDLKYFMMSERMHRKVLNFKLFEDYFMTPSVLT